MSGPRSTQPSVVLQFKTEYAKDFFLGQLSDGWGENCVGLTWDHSRPMGEAPILVEVYSDYEEHHEIVDEESDRQAQRMKRFRMSGGDQ